MAEEIKRLEKCLSAMKKCLKVPHFENCVCFSDAFKVLNAEVEQVEKQIDKFDADSKERFLSFKKEIEGMTKLISKGEKECLGCSPCAAQAVFKAYPEQLNQVYLDDNRASQNFG